MVETDTSTGTRTAPTYVTIQIGGGADLSNDTLTVVGPSSIWAPEDPTRIAGLTIDQVAELRGLEQALANFQGHYWALRKHLEGIADALHLDEEYDFKDFPKMVGALKTEIERQGEEIERLRGLVEELEW